MPHFAWSVSWPERFQLLAHYYPGVHVRDAANANAIVTPAWRGNVLRVGWARPRGDPSGICGQLEVWLHNSGITTWYDAQDGYYAQQVGLGYCWNGVCTAAGLLPQAVAPGGDVRVALWLPPGSGAGQLELDLYWQAESDPRVWFSPAWPRQLIGVFSAVAGHCARLPLLTR
ncbi:MAG: hypothetical protein FJ011_17870 [Chloroflexi bacterium]|nr:hypothetical protein [Chloroflexota bacterium]